MIAVDNLDNIAELGAAASARGLTLGVVIEIDTGMRRAGLLPGEAARCDGAPDRADARLAI